MWMIGPSLGSNWTALSCGNCITWKWIWMLCICSKFYESNVDYLCFYNHGIVFISTHFFFLSANIHVKLNSVAYLSYVMCKGEPLLVSTEQYQLSLNWKWICKLFITSNRRFASITQDNSAKKSQIYLSICNFEAISISTVIRNVKVTKLFCEAWWHIVIYL